MSKMALLLGAGSAMAPVLLFKITTPQMAAWEIGISVTLMIGGGVLGFLLANKHPFLAFAVVPATVLATSYAAWQTFYSIREAKIAPLRQRLADYLDISVQRPAHRNSPATIIQGRIVAVDMKKRDIDPFQLLLPESLRARSPTEVGIVLQLNWGEEPVGRYPGGGNALRRFCDARLVATAPKGRLLHEGRFYGTEPPAKGGSSDLLGPPPYSQLIEFLKTHSDSTTAN